MSSWNRLIRFVKDNGAESFGEPCIETDQQLTDQLAKNELWAIELNGPSPVGPLVRGDKAHVHALRDILKPNDVPIVRCIGLNYMKHSMLNCHCVQPNTLILLTDDQQSKKAAENLLPTHQCS